LDNDLRSKYYLKKNNNLAFSLSLHIVRRPFLTFVSYILKDALHTNSAESSFKLLVFSLVCRLSSFVRSAQYNRFRHTRHTYMDKWTTQNKAKANGSESNEK